MDLQTNDSNISYEMDLQTNDSNISYENFFY